MTDKPLRNKFSHGIKIMCSTIIGKILLFSIISLGACAAADTYYVSPSGNNQNSGDQDHPWNTVTHALKKAGPGVTIVLRSGIYDEQLVIDRGGEAGSPLILCSAAGERAILDGRQQMKYGIYINAPYVEIRNLEIRNYTNYGIFARGPNVPIWRELPGPGAHHLSVSESTIHHIGSAVGITENGVFGIRVAGVSDFVFRHNTVYMITGNNESFGLHYDIFSTSKNTIKGTVIESNLLYFIDKTGVRIVDNGYPQENRSHVIGEPLYVKGNIFIHNTFSGFETNYVGGKTENSGPLGNNCNAPIHMEHNFSGWNSNGTNPKHSHNFFIEHNTFYRNFRAGYYMCGLPICQNGYTGWNIFAENALAVDIDLPGKNNLLEGNYYWLVSDQQRFFRDQETRRTYTSLTDAQLDSNFRHEKKGIFDSSIPIFVNPGKGDFSVFRNSPARGTAPSGMDFGADHNTLKNVGSQKKYGITNIPLLPELKLKIIAFSSQYDGFYNPWLSPSGFAENLVDNDRSTSWVTAKGQPLSWVIFEIIGAPQALGVFAVSEYMHYDPKHHSGKSSIDNITWKGNVKKIKMYCRNAENEEWRDAGTYYRYYGAAGRFYELPEDTVAKQIKLEIIENWGHSDVSQIAEFKLYKRFVPFE